ncbi:LppX_LprAFG lipoprotein [Oerskovia sp. NPDC060287]|uniref:LppX_LprAFG lipoprotein n=1 Tax=Oerskovia sp. NPDC060287 TaxID=3347095 RepID=UPI003652BB32
MRLVRGIAVLSVASVGVLGLAACSSGTDAPASSSSASASSESDKAPAEKASSDLTAENFVQRITDAQIAAGSVSMATTTEVQGTSMDMTGDIVFTDGSQNLAMTMTVPGSGEMQVRFVDGIFYMNMGELSQNKFVAIDPADESNPMASSFEGLTEQMDPAASVEALEGAITSVEKEGEPVDIDGVKAQQYTVVVDTTKLTGSIKEQADAAGTALPETLTYQYWIDADDLMRKVVMDVMGTSMEMTFSNWGEDLEVVAPSADEISTEPLF